jgi:hypothetical protein
VKLVVLAVMLAVIARARVAILPGWTVPLPALILAAGITACAAFVAWLIHQARREPGYSGPSPEGAPS